MSAPMQKLQQEIDELQGILRAKEADLILAAQLGQALLESNNQLTSQYDSAVGELSSKVASLEQANHSLSSQLELAQRQLNFARKEVEREGQAARDELDSERQTLHRKEKQQLFQIQQLAVELESVKSELERFQTSEAALMDKISQQAATVSSLQTALRDSERKRSRLRKKWFQALSVTGTAPAGTGAPSLAESGLGDSTIANVSISGSNNGSSDDDGGGDEPGEDDDFVAERIYSLEEATAKQRQLIQEKDSTIHGLEKAVARLEADAALLQSRLAGMEKLKAESESQIISLTNTVSSHRERIDELEQERAMAEALQNGSMVACKSVLSDIEDRRAELEQQVSSYRIKYDHLLRVHEATRQQQKRLCIQMASLLQMSGGKADHSRMSRLEQELSQSQSEIRALRLQLEQLEQDYKSAQQKLMKASLFTEQGASGALGQTQASPPAATEKQRAYIEYLESEAEAARAALDVSKKEARTRQMLQLNESNKVRDLASQLYRQEALIESLKSENLQLKIKLEETAVTKAHVATSEPPQQPLQLPSPSAQNSLPLRPSSRAESDRSNLPPVAKALPDQTPPVSLKQDTADEKENAQGDFLPSASASAPVLPGKSRPEQSVKQAASGSNSGNSAKVISIKSSDSSANECNQQ